MRALSNFFVSMQMLISNPGGHEDFNVQGCVNIIKVDQYVPLILKY